jgi:arylsulfatase A-like enzyme
VNGESAEDGLMCVNGIWQVSTHRQTAAAALYDAGIRFVDDQIGRIDRALEQMGVLDNTIVVLTSDHGESLGEHGTFGHGAFLYNQVLQIPLVIRYPRVFAAGTRVETPVSLVDIFPTVQEIVGLPPVSGLQGSSLRDLEALAGRPTRVIAQYAPVPERVWRATGAQLECDYSLAGRSSLSLQTTSLKYIWSSDGQSELYDLASDPGETRNLAPSSLEVVRGLEQDLLGWFKKIESEANDRTIVPIDPATRKRLESLGYIR